MDLKSRRSGTVSVLELSGRFDAYVTPPIDEWLERAAAADPAHVVVNLAGVTFVDSTALATLVQAMRRCRQQHGDLRLCGLQPPVRIIFDLTRLDRAFKVYPGEAEAVSSFGGSPA